MSTAAAPAPVDDQMNKNNAEAAEAAKALEELKNFKESSKADVDGEIEKLNKHKQLNRLDTNARFEASLFAHANDDSDVEDDKGLDENGNIIKAGDRTEATRLKAEKKGEMDKNADTLAQKVDELQIDPAKVNGEAEKK